VTVAIATPLSKIELTPGSAMQISGVNWESYIALMQELGDTRSTRIAYANGVLEIRMPGQQHEVLNRTAILSRRFVILICQSVLATPRGIDSPFVASTLQALHPKAGSSWG
jgi:hypothetical protein